MTPDDVVARAKELEGQEVLLTVRGVVKDCGQWLIVGTGRTIADHDRPLHDLVSIEPAPLRIEPGELYRNGAGELLRGDATGGLQGFDGYIGADEITADSELVRVRVVEA